MASAAEDSAELKCACGVEPHADEHLVHPDRKDRGRKRAKTHWPPAMAAMLIPPRTADQMTRKATLPVYCSVDEPIGVSFAAGSTLDLPSGRSGGVSGGRPIEPSQLPRSSAQIVLAGTGMPAMLYA